MSRGRTAARTVVLALALALWVGAAPAHAELKAIWGPDATGSGISAWPMYEDLGVEVVQRPIAWSLIAPGRPERPRDPNDPAYNWPASIDTGIAEGRKRGIKIALLVKKTPAWANGNRTPNWAPDKARDFADFMFAASRRYPAVRHWMIWGEPSQPFNFLPLPDNSPVGPRRYALLLDGAYGALKQANRRNVVIGGMTFTGGSVKPPQWLRWMRLPNGKPPRLDWYGHNPFSRRFPSLRKRVYSPGIRDFSDIDTLIKEVRRVYRRIGRKPKLWLAEWTVQSDNDSGLFDFHVTRSQQSRWISAAYRIAHRKRYVAGLGWFKLQDEAGPRAPKLGLIDTDSRPKPSYYAYKLAR